MYQPIKQEEVCYVSIYGGEFEREDIIIKKKYKQSFINRMLASDKQDGVIEIFNINKRKKLINVRKTTLILGELKLFN